MTTNSNNLISKFLNKSLSKEEANDLISTYFCPTQDPLGDIKKLQEHLDTCVERSRETCIKGPLAFSPIEAEQALIFFSDPKQFDLKLNKAKQKQLLYGAQQVRARRAFINDLPEEWRVPMLLRKLKSENILDHILSVLGISLPDEKQKEGTITNIIDIGMSHSVYCVTACYETLCKSYVVKQEQLPHQAFHCQLLTALGYESFKTYHIQDQLGAWDISEYLGPQNLNDYLLSHEAYNETLITQLAKQAALGDILGRGDRHFENYILSGEALLPLDISYLCWEGNEEWTKKYVWGGMYEVNIAQKWPEKESECLDLFFKTFAKECTDLASKKDIIISLIKTFYWEEDPETQRKIAFIESRLKDPEKYAQEMEALYRESLVESKKRDIYRHRLDEIAKSKLERLEEEPYLRMYEQAHQDRIANFFICEDQPQDILAKIDAIK